MYIRRKEVDQYIGLFPDKVYKNIYETRLYGILKRMEIVK